MSVGETQTFPLVGVVREDNSVGASDQSGAFGQSSPQGLDWVDPKVTRITCSFVKRDVVAEFLDKVGVLKLDVSLNVIVIDLVSLSIWYALLGHLPNALSFIYMPVCFLTESLLSPRWLS